MTIHTDTSRSGDLVERLRDLAAKFEGQGGKHYTAALFGECADRIEALEASVTGLTHQRDFLRESVDLSDQRIEALEAENKRLREALREIARLRTDLRGDFSLGSKQSDIARAALGEK